ncbi:cilia-and flagella-associated protein 96-like [Clavelina lepadiformis]|uniref:Cilia-and flagella-associated protein 96 n=1 Tax=Clavelina lepadiformis TaxID=159417 RepID=A0ABP0FWN6_CLALP
MAGTGGGKTDMERIGLFSEVGYTTIGDKYPKVHVSSLPFNDAAYKGKHMLPGGSKARSALQAGYFDSQFKRILEKEAYTDPVKLRRQQRLKESKKNIGKAFLPNSGSKLPSGLGNSYGTFSGPVGAFSPVSRPRKPYTAPGRNFTTNPGKQGTGYGYVNLTLGKQHEHAVEAFDKAKELRRKELSTHKSMLKGGAFKLNLHPSTYFDKNPYRTDKSLGPSKGSSSKLPAVKPFKPSSPPKKIGGAKAGTFDPYPSHSNDPYTVKQRKSVIKNKEGKLFHPSPGNKSSPTRSVVAQNVIKSMHRDNYKTIQSVMAY